MSVSTNLLAIEERLFLAYCYLEKHIRNKQIIDKFYYLFSEDNINIMFKEIEIIEKLSYKNRPKRLFRHIKKTLKKASFLFFIKVKNLKCFVKHKQTKSD